MALVIPCHPTLDDWLELKRKRDSGTGVLFANLGHVC